MLTNSLGNSFVPQIKGDLECCLNRSQKCSLPLQYWGKFGATILPFFTSNFYSIKWEWKRWLRKYLRFLCPHSSKVRDAIPYGTPSQVLWYLVSLFLAVLHLAVIISKKGQHSKTTKRRKRIKHLTFEFQKPISRQKTLLDLEEYEINQRHCSFLNSPNQMKIF